MICFNLLRVLSPEQCYVTCFRCDGIGAQAHAILATMLFAFQANIKYIHTPLEQVAHKPKDIIDWESRWNNFFGFNNYSEVVDNFNFNLFKYRNFPTYKIEKNTIFTLNDPFWVLDINPDSFNEIQSRIVYCYRLSPKRNYLHKSRSCNSLQISVHVRRGDALLSENSHRLTDEFYTFNCLTKITKVLKDCGYDYHIHIFSEGNIKDFIYLNKLNNTNFWLNEDAFMTFDSLVSADILLLSKSSFSYSSALLANGIVFYEPFWHNPLSHWISLDDVRYENNSRRFKSELQNQLNKFIKNKI